MEANTWLFLQNQSTYSTLFHAFTTVVVNVLYEGWCIKESGTQFLGKTNWKKRWFKLIQQIDNSVYLQYYKYKQAIDNHRLYF